MLDFDLLFTTILAEPSPTALIFILPSSVMLTCATLELDELTLNAWFALDGYTDTLYDTSSYSGFPTYNSEYAPPIDISLTAELLILSKIT